MFKDTSKMMTWYIWMVTYLRRNVTIVRGTSYHLLGSWISQDSKIRFWVQVKSYISNYNLANRNILASYVSCLNAMAYDTYPPYLAQILGYVVTCGVKMMWLCHGWGWQPPQTASHFYIKHIQHVWAHWYAVHWHRVAAQTVIPTWLGSDFGVLGTCCDYVMVDADRHLKLLPTSILDIYKVMEHIDMLSIGIE